MERTPGDDGEPPAEVERGDGWDLPDVTFINDLDEQKGLCRVKYDSVQATPSFAIITVVSHITGIDPLELDPLYETIDTDALDALFTADRSLGSQLTFQYSGCEITVGTDDVVEADLK